MKKDIGEIMGFARTDIKNITNAIDSIELFASDNALHFERISEDEISLHMECPQMMYQLNFSWMEDQEILHVASIFDNYSPDKHKKELNRLISKINGQMIVGHFDYLEEDHIMAYRYALVLSGGIFPTTEQISYIINCAVQSCENYYQAYRLVSLVGETAEKSLKYSLFETSGNA